MSLKTNVENHPVIWFATTLVTGFVAGIGCVMAIQQVAGARPLWPAEYRRCQELIQRETNHLSEEPLHENRIATLERDIVGRLVLFNMAFEYFDSTPMSEFGARSDWGKLQFAIEALNGRSPTSDSAVSSDSRTFVLLLSDLYCSVPDSRKPELRRALVGATRLIAEIAGAIPDRTDEYVEKYRGDFYASYGLEKWKSSVVLGLQDQLSHPADADRAPSEPKYDDDF